MWLNVISQAFDKGGDKSLFDHPAIKKAVETIEKETQSGEKGWSSDHLSGPCAHLSIC
jgi:hypothetical protein